MGRLFTSVPVRFAKILTFSGVLFCVSLPVLAQEDWTLPSLSLASQIMAFIASYQTVFGGVLGAGLGYLAKWLFDELSAERAARRQFAQSVSEQITTLATKYYWSLANHAGVLAGLLEFYLEHRTYHLVILWQNRKDLENRLDEIATECAEASFHSFCRLIGLFDEFQFQGSNTYLLTSHAAGETSKRLYNTFIASLPTEERRIDTLKIVKVLREERPSDSTGQLTRVQDFPSALFMETIARNELKEELQHFTQWVKNSVAEVDDAADALRAYNELLNHELAHLYRHGFKKQGADDKLYLKEVAFNEWPYLLTSQSYAAIQKSNQQSTLLRPLGAPNPIQASDKAMTRPDNDEQDTGNKTSSEDQIEKTDKNKVTFSLQTDFGLPVNTQGAKRHELQGVAGNAGAGNE